MPWIDWENLTELPARKKQEDKPLPPSKRSGKGWKPARRRGRRRRKTKDHIKLELKRHRGWSDAKT